MPTSLGGRLIAGVALFTIVTLVVTLVTMHHLLERFVTGQIDQRLDNKIVALASQTRLAPDGTLHLDGDADGPPFDEPKHKSFWRVAGPRNAVESRWLPAGAFQPPDADEVAALGEARPRPDVEPIGGSRRHPQTLDWPGPGGEPMYVRARVERIGATPVVILAAAPWRAISDPLQEALRTLAIAILLVGAASLAAGFALVRLTLRPLTQLRRDVATVRIGGSRAIPEDQPVEIKPLVDELNSLLAQNAANLVRARQHVANLAHGLKTPLATLALGVSRVDGEGRHRLRPLVDQIERRVRHHLSRARAAALDGTVRAQTHVKPKIEDLVDALQKIYAEKRIVVELRCPDDMVVACEPQDLDEILGNLLDNAFKYTRTRVVCAVGVRDAQVAIEIVDDGPGLPEAEIARALRPGQRIDEQVPGFGFGLPIARELVELYAGSLTLGPHASSTSSVKTFDPGSSSPKGLVVTVTLPLPRA